MAQNILLMPAAKAIELLNDKAIELDELQRRCDVHGAIQRNLDLFAKWKAKMDFLLPTLFQDGTAASNKLKHRRDTPVFYAAGEHEDGELIAEVKSYSFNLAALIEAIPHMRVAESAKAGRSGKGKAGPSNNTTIKIFISHSFKDKDFAAAVVDLLEATLNIPPDAIRCTSVDGYKLEAGDSPETLRLNIQSCDVLVALLTPASLESGFVLMELGAAWGFNKRICPVLAPGLTFNLLPGPSGPLHAVIADDRVGMSGVIDAVHKATQLSFRDNPRRERGMGGYMRQIPSLFPSSL